MREINFNLPLATQFLGDGDGDGDGDADADGQGQNRGRRVGLGNC